MVVGGLRPDRDGMERCRRDMESQVAMGNKERIVIEGISMLA